MSESETKGIIDRLFGQFGRYDFLCRFFPGIALYALIARFTESGCAKPNFLLDMVIACVAGLCIDALGSLFGKCFVAKKRVGYKEYLEERGKNKNGDAEIKTNLNMLELRRVMYRNTSIMLSLFLGVKIYEVSKFGVRYEGDIFIVVITLVAVFACGYNSRRIDYYKQKRIKFSSSKDADKTKKEK